MRQHPKLAQARAYWRLAAKADRAGSHRQAEHYRSVAESKYREYQRSMEFSKRLQAQRDAEAARRQARREAQQ